jgi:hypothetical protein
VERGKLVEPWNVSPGGVAKNLRGYAAPNPCESYPRSSAFIGGHIFFAFFMIL